MINDLTTAIRAKMNMVRIETHEEGRLMKACFNLAAKNSFMPVEWSRTRGLRKIDGERLLNGDPMEECSPAFLFSPALLDAKDEQGADMRLLIFVKDLLPDINEPFIQRLIRDELAAGKERHKSAMKYFVFIDTAPWPVDMKGVMKIDMPLPDRAVLGGIVDNAVAAYFEGEAAAQYTNGARDAIVSALTGLTADEAADAVVMCYVKHKAILPKILMQQKKSLINTAALRYEEPDPRGLEGIGGLEIMKSHLLRLRASFTEKARAWGLPRPKGFFLAGLPGCGKSLSAKCAATVFDLPLIRLDVGAIFGSLVGESESNMRTVMKTLGAIAPCVLFVDEIEKAFGGAGGGERDGGTSQRVFGDFLSWLNDSDKGVFVIATSNKPASLPPELMRAGRFDYFYWIGQPNTDERVAICEVMKKKFQHTEGVDSQRIAKMTEDYTGIEIETAFKEGMTFAFERGGIVTTDDVLAGLKTVMPIAKSFGAELQRVKDWGAVNCRAASAPDKSKTAATQTAGRFDT